MRLLKYVISKNKLAIILFFVISGLNLAVFYLYGCLIEAWLYAVVISLFFLVCFLVVDYIIEYARLKKIKEACLSIKAGISLLPTPQSPVEDEYISLISSLSEKISTIITEKNRLRQGDEDYYTAWVHQIKTPIAVIKLKLSYDTPENQALMSELFRIEQYVDMVLSYLRLDSPSTDLLVTEYELDDLIRETIRLYAPQFIGKKLRLNFTPTEKTIITDKKWFSCILEQLISNAVKYTQSGEISIFLEDDMLKISDTGIGIAKEDLPRIFERGFTGVNGRIGEKSSGLGLYLASRAARMISLSLDVKSEIGKGTTFIIDIKDKLTQR